MLPAHPRGPREGAGEEGERRQSSLETQVLPEGEKCIVSNKGVEKEDKHNCPWQPGQKGWLPGQQQKDGGHQTAEITGENQRSTVQWITSCPVCIYQNRKMLTVFQVNVVG